MDDVHTVTQTGLHATVTAGGPVSTADPQSGPVRLAAASDSADGLARWLITRHDDVIAALSDPRLSSEQVYPRDCAVARLITEEQTSASAQLTAAGTLSRTMIASDPPVHTRLRKLVVREFSAKRLDALRPRVQQIADELADAVAVRGEVDLIRSFAFPLAVRTIGELLGVSDEVRTLLPSEDEREAPMIPIDVAHAAAVDWIEARRHEPADDLLGTLVAAHEQGQLSYEELVGMPFVLLIAGHVTTGHLIGNGVWTLLQHPEQLAELRRDPALVASAVDEVLRHVGPATLVSRYALEDVEIGGTTIPAGSYVRAMLSAARHDRDRFPDPDRFDIHRGDGAELAFGHGIHYCLGARLAKMEGEIAISTVLRRFPDLALAEPVTLSEREEGIIGLEKLPVRLRGR